MREFLKGLDLDGEVIDTIMAEHGKLMTKSVEKSATLGEQLKAAQESLTTANAEIERYKGMDFEGIQKAAAEYQAKFEEAERTANDRISEMEYNVALKDALAGEKFTSEFAKRGVFEEIKAKQLPLENGAIMGLSDALKSMRESSPDAFAVEQTKVPATATFSGAGKTSVAPTELDGIKADYEKARKSGNSVRMVEIRMEAKQKGIQIE